MKNLKYIMATLMVALVVAVVCVACSKEKETPVQEANNNSENEPNTEVVERKPIALMNPKSNEIEYLVSVEDIQCRINAASKSANHYVVESWEIIDDKEDELSSLPYLKYVILDTENEVSHKTVLLDSFIVKQQSAYYLSDDVANTHYYFTTVSSDDKIFVIEVNDNDVVASEWDGVSMLPPGGNSCTCTSDNKCLHNNSHDYVCQPFHDGIGWRCDPQCDNNHGKCDKSETATIVTVSFLKGLTL